MIKIIAYIILAITFSFGLSLSSESFTGIYKLGYKDSLLTFQNKQLNWVPKLQVGEAVSIRIIWLEKNEYLVTFRDRDVTKCLGMSAAAEVAMVNLASGCYHFDLQPKGGGNFLFKIVGTDLFLSPEQKTIGGFILQKDALLAESIILISDYIVDKQHAYELQHLRRYYIKSSDGRYAYLDPNQGLKLSTDYKTAFKVIFLPGNKISLRAENKKFLGASSEFYTFFVEWRSGWESFQLLQNESNKIILRTAHNTYLSADLENGGIGVTPKLPQESKWLAFHEALDQDSKPLIAQAEDDQEETLSNHRRALVLAQQIEHQLIQDEIFGKGMLGTVYLVKSPLGEKRVIKIPGNPKLSYDDQKSLRETYSSDVLLTFKLLAKGVPVAPIIKVLAEDAHLKEYIPGPLLSKIISERPLELEHDVNLMRTKLLNLFYSLIDKKLYVSDLHTENIIWQEGEPESSGKNHRWVIIDFGNVVENYTNDKRQLADEYATRLSDQHCDDNCKKYIIEPLKLKY